MLYVELLGRDLAELNFVSSDSFRHRIQAEFLGRSLGKREEWRASHRVAHIRFEVAPATRAFATIRCASETIAERCRSPCQLSAYTL